MTRLLTLVVVVAACAASLASARDGWQCFRVPDGSLMSQLLFEWRYAHIDSAEKETYVEMLVYNKTKRAYLGEGQGLREMRKRWHTATIDVDDDTSSATDPTLIHLQFWYDHATGEYGDSAFASEARSNILDGAMYNTIASEFDDITAVYTTTPFEFTPCPCDVELFGPSGGCAAAACSFTAGDTTDFEATVDASATSADECCNTCAADPLCAFAAFESNACTVYAQGNGTATTVCSATGDSCSAFRAPGTDLC